MEQPRLIELAPIPQPSTVQLLESLLFIAGEPLSIAQMAQALEIAPEAVEAALGELHQLCQQRGIRVQRVADTAQLVSAPEAASVIERFLGVGPQPKPSPAALETLAIIAYRQPITRAQIEAIRGVDSSGVVRALLARDLISEAGRLESLGRPILYATTAEFLRQFGLSSLADLPEIDLPEIPAELSEESTA